MSKKKTLKNLIKISVTSIGLYLAYRQIDPQLLNTNWEDYNLWLFVLSAILAVSNVFFTSSRLYIILERKVPFKFLIKSDLIASFFNLFLPSTIGGDIMKIARISDYSGSVSNSTVRVILDRFLGVVSIILSSCIFSIIGITTGIVQLPLPLFYLVAGIVVLTILSFVLLFKMNLERFEATEFNIKIFNYKKTIVFQKWMEAIYEIRQISFKDILLVIFFSSLYHLNASLISFLCLKFLGVNISLFYVILFRNVTAVLLMLPISIAGLGMRDFIYKELYGSIASSPQVLLLAPLIFILTCIVGLVGGIVFLLDKKKKSENKN